MKATRSGQCATKQGNSTAKGTYASVYKSRLDENVTGKSINVALKEYLLPLQKGDDEAMEVTAGNLEFMVDDFTEMLIPMAPHSNVAHYYGIEFIPGMIGDNLDRVQVTCDWVEMAGVEWAKGGTKLKGPIPEPEVKHIAKGILSALKHIHAHGITHDDLRPCNIMYTHVWPEVTDTNGNGGRTKEEVDFEKANGFAHPVLVDYNIFKKIQDVIDPMGGGATTKQKPAYCAPEVFTDGKDYDSARTDIWSLACCVLELLSGKAPFHELDPSGKGNVMFKIIQSRTPPKYPDGISADCKSFLDACFDRNKETRPDAATALAHAWFSS